MTDYNKFKVVELEKLLKERGLPEKGKKAELIARLQEDDNKKTVTTAAAEDEIDWNDDEDLEKPAESATAAAVEDKSAQEDGAKGEATKSASAEPKATEQTAANGASAASPKDDAAATAAQTDDKPVEAEKAPVDFSAGLKETTIEEELEKRIARVKKFGGDPATDEGVQKLERMKKFGNASELHIDEALPIRAEKRKRGREDDSGRGNFKKGRNFRGKGRGARGGRRDGGRRNEARGNGPQNNGAPKTAGHGLSDADRKAAEARRARFEKA